MYRNCVTLYSGQSTTATQMTDEADRLFVRIPDARFLGKHTRIEAHNRANCRALSELLERSLEGLEIDVRTKPDDEPYQGVSCIIYRFRDGDRVREYDEESVLTSIIKKWTGWP